MANPNPRNQFRKRSPRARQLGRLGGTRTAQRRAERQAAEAEAQARVAGPYAENLLAHWVQELGGESKVSRLAQAKLRIAAHALAIVEYLAPKAKWGDAPAQAELREHGALAARILGDFGLPPDAPRSPDAAAPRRLAFDERMQAAAERRAAREAAQTHAPSADKQASATDPDPEAASGGDAPDAPAPDAGNATPVRILCGTPRCGAELPPDGTLDEFCQVCYQRRWVWCPPPGRPGHDAGPSQRPAPEQFIREQYGTGIYHKRHAPAELVQREGCTITQREVPPGSRCQKCGTWLLEADRARRERGEI